MRPDRYPYNRRPTAPTPPVPVAPPPPKPDAGPRPLSARQQAHLQGTPLPPPPGPPKSAPVATATHPAPTRLARRRAIPKKAVRVRASRPPRNRRRVNVPRLLLGWATLALVAECVVAALWSPRFWVRELIVEGNTTVPTETLTRRLALPDRTNLFRLSPRRLAGAAGAEPTVEVAEIRRTLPGTVRLVVRERTPWAVVQMGGGGAWYVIDRHLVPFRVGEKPEAGLPLLAIGTPASGAGNASKPPVLGKVITAPGLVEVSKCLSWSSARPDFPLERITIDSDGKLCLNRSGGVLVTLGSGIDLDRKLDTLSLLLARRADLKGSGESRIASVNLIAYDAPALTLREPASGAKNDDRAVPPATSVDGADQQSPQ